MPPLPQPLGERAGGRGYAEDSLVSLFCAEDSRLKGSQQTLQNRDP